MKTKELRQIILEEKYLRQITDGTWTWNNDGSVDIKGNVNLNHINLSDKIPFKIRKVIGYFEMLWNYSITTLENCPDEVTDWFRYNSELISIDFLPKRIGGCLYMGHRNGIEYANYNNIKEEDIRKIYDIKDRVVFGNY